MTSVQNKEDNLQLCIISINLKGCEKAFVFLSKSHSQALVLMLSLIYTNNSSKTAVPFLSHSHIPAAYWKTKRWTLQGCQALTGIDQAAVERLDELPIRVFLAVCCHLLITNGSCDICGECEEGRKKRML